MKGSNMKAIVVAALLALSFTTGFTCSKNQPEATEAVSTETAPAAEGTTTEAAPAAEGTATEAAPAAPAEGAAAPAAPATETTH